MVEAVVERPERLTRTVPGGAPGSGAWRRLAAAFSLASLCYLRVWSELLHRTPRAQFLAEAPPQPVEYGAVLINVAVLTGFLWLLFRTAHSHPRGWRGGAARLALALSLLLPLLGLRAIWLRAGTLDSSAISSGLVGRSAPSALKLLLLGAVVALVVRFHRRLVALLETGALLLAVFAVYAGARAIWGAARPQDSFVTHPPAAHANGAAGGSAGRAVWVIFDEWDAGLAFAQRPAGLRLEEFDRLRSESIWAAQARAPGNGTMVSVSALLSGLRVRGARPVDADRLLIRLGDSGKVVEWSSLPNLFQHVRRQGGRSGVVGWHLPYCRVLGGELDECYWAASATQANSARGSFFGIAFGQARSLVETERLSPFGQALTIQRHVQDYHALLGQAVSLVGRRDLDLVYLHLPLPHGPFAYDRRTRRFDVLHSPPRRYLDNLELADHTWGVLRRTIEAAGLWDSTTVLLSSDHPWRGARSAGFPAEGRVPFMLKLAGQRQGLSYSRPMNTRCSQVLLLEALRGHLPDAAGAVALLDHHCAEPGP